MSYLLAGKRAEDITQQVELPRTENTAFRYEGKDYQVVSGYVIPHYESLYKTLTDEDKLTLIKDFSHQFLQEAGQGVQIKRSEEEIDAISYKQAGTQDPELNRAYSELTIGAIVRNIRKLAEEGITTRQHILTLKQKYDVSSDIIDETILEQTLFINAIRDNQDIASIEEKNWDVLKQSLGISNEQLNMLVASEIFINKRVEMANALNPAELIKPLESSAAMEALRRLRDLTEIQIEETFKLPNIDMQIQYQIAAVNKLLQSDEKLYNKDTIPGQLIRKYTSQMNLVNQGKIDEMTSQIRQGVANAMKSIDDVCSTLSEVSLPEKTQQLINDLCEHSKQRVGMRGSDIDYVDIEAHRRAAEERLRENIKELEKKENQKGTGFVARISDMDAEHIEMLDHILKKSVKLLSQLSLLREGLPGEVMKLKDMVQQHKSPDTLVNSMKQRFPF